jgi:serine/threonine-protein kinase
MTGAASLAGTTLGRYRLVEKLGAGGMATVYRADDPALGRQVAVKVMHPFIAERSEAGSRFEREAKAVAGLRHPNVMALHDYAPASPEHPAYLVMELLTGPSLQRFLVEHGAPLAEVAAMLGLRIAQALGAAHARGIVHRDVKPENVMFDGHRVVLCDFGIARVAAADGVTATGAVLGSPAYMSPEQAQGGEVDARSDQFSLGALLYQLATGALPFSGSSPLVTMAKIVKGDYPPPSAKNARVPPYLERVLARLLRSEPEARFPSVDACADALRQGLVDDGFHDVDAELANYLRDPAGYNAAAERRIVDAALAQAERAKARGETARALAAAGRVLAWKPDEPRALALTAGLSSRSRRVALAVAGGLALASAVAVLGMRRLAVTEVPHPLHVVAPQRAPQPQPLETTVPPPNATTAPATTAAATTGAATSGVATSKPHHARLPPPAPTGATVAAAVDPSPAPVVAPKPAPDAPATLAVAIAPWCDLTVDGNARGRSPATLTLPPGPHHLVCVNPSSGRRLTRDLTLAAGEQRELREKLYATVRVQPRLSRGDAFAVDGSKPASAAADVEPGRRRVTLYKAGAEVETRWLDVPPAGCTLVDAPSLACEKP